jgi:hypothetical protein
VDSGLGIVHKLNYCRIERLPLGPPTVRCGRSATVEDVSLPSGRGRRPDFFTNRVSSFSLTWHSFHFPWHATRQLRPYAHGSERIRLDKHLSRLNVITLGAFKIPVAATAS